MFPKHIKRIKVMAVKIKRYILVGKCYASTDWTALTIATTDCSYIALKFKQDSFKALTWKNLHFMYAK